MKITAYKLNAVNKMWLSPDDCIDYTECSPLERVR